MTEYKIRVEKTKYFAKCRICKTNIKSGEVVVKMDIIDDYSGNKGMQVHAECLLPKIIKEVIKLKQENIKDIEDKVVEEMQNIEHLKEIKDLLK